jgi:hypothetical protein
LFVFEHFALVMYRNSWLIGGFFSITSNRGIIPETTSPQTATDLYIFGLQWHANLRWAPGFLPAQSVVGGAAASENR